MTLSSVRTKHWTRVEYERLVDLGAFRPGERLELVGGVLVVRGPQGGPHATAVGLAEDALREAFGVGWTVRAHSAIALDEDSVPEPDIAVVPGTRRDYRRGHPSHPVLIVEVPGSPTTGSSTSLTMSWSCTGTRSRIPMRPMAGATARPRHCMLATW